MGQFYLCIVKLSSGSFWTKLYVICPSFEKRLKNLCCGQKCTCVNVFSMSVKRANMPWRHLIFMKCRTFEFTMILLIHIQSLAIILICYSKSFLPKKSMYRNWFIFLQTSDVKTGFGAWCLEFSLTPPISIFNM